MGVIYLGDYGSGKRRGSPARREGGRFKERQDDWAMDGKPWLL